MKNIVASLFLTLTAAAQAQSYDPPAYPDDGPLWDFTLPPCEFCNVVLMRELDQCDRITDTLERAWCQSQAVENDLYCRVEYLCDSDYVARAIVAWAQYQSGAIDAAGYAEAVSQ